MARRRRLQCALAAFGAMAALVSVAQDPGATAAAPANDNCSNEQTIFVNTTATEAQYGTSGTIYIRDRDLDPACSSPITWSMVDITSNDFNSNVETGYLEKSVTGSHFFVWHSCWQINGNEHCLDLDRPVISVGSDVNFKAANDPVGSDEFNTWIDVGGGWVISCSGGCGEKMPYTSGMSMGEAGRYGDGTGMLDHHWAMTFKDSSSTFESWPGQSEYQHNIDNGTYYYHKNSATAFEVCGSGGPCPWQ